MQATRPEDVREILDTIPDHDKFNMDLQHLLFDRLFVEWQRLDAAQQIQRTGCIVRWQHVAILRSSVEVSTFGSSSDALDVDDHTMSTYVGGQKDREQCGLKRNQGKMSL